MGLGAGRVVEALVGVGAEIIALGLEQIGGETFAAVGVEEGEGGAEGGDGDAFLGGNRDNGAPRAVRGLYSLAEERIEQEVGQLGIFIEGFFDFAQKDAADDAAAAPHEGDAAVVEVPVVFLRRSAHEHVALGVGDDFRGVERTTDVFDDFFVIAFDGGLGAFELFGSGDAFVFKRGDAAGVHGFGNEGDGDAEFLGGNHGPFAGAFLAGGVEDFVHEGLAVGVFEGEDVAGDFDQIGVEFALVPVGEDLVHLVGAHAEAGFEQVVGFADELHVAVFDAVVDHFDVMAGAVFADPIAAGGAILDFGGDLLENLLDVGPGGGRTAGHNARAVPRALFAAGNAGADVEQALGLDVFGPAHGVLEERIAAVNDDVAGFEMREQVLDELIHGGAGLDHEHDAARLLEQAGQFLEGMSADDVSAFGFLVEKVVHLRDGAIESDHGEAVVVHVEDEVLAHDGEADECDVSFGVHNVSNRAIGDAGRFPASFSGWAKRPGSFH